MLGINAALGAMTSGLGAAMQGKPVLRSAAVGAGGGAIVYGGKRIAGDGFPGSGLLGRQVAAVGTSMVSNVAAGAGPFSTMTLPIGIARVRVHGPNGGSATVRLDLPAAVATVYMVAKSDRDFDLGRSISAGTPVFTGPSESMAGGKVVAGVIWVRDGSPASMRSILAHEQVHMVQSDFTLPAWSYPAERRLVAVSAPTRAVQRYIDFRFDRALAHMLNGVIDYDQRPWEREARHLSRTGSY